MRLILLLSALLAAFGGVGSGARDVQARSYHSGIARQPSVVVNATTSGRRPAATLPRLPLRASGGVMVAPNPQPGYLTRLRV
jgi:hypothetical protein